MKKVDDLVFTDDYMFGAVMRDPYICTKILERVLKIKIEHIEYPELQKAIKPYYESKGVRLDVYVKDTNQVFDVEVQSSEPADVAKRTRYYQSMVDIDCLAKGQAYESLPKSYIIFFCKQDWLKTGVPVATFQNRCKENTNLTLNDGSTKIFLNAELWEKEADVETRAFMNYIYNSKVTDELSSEIENKVILTKINEIFRNDYLSMNLHDHDIIYKAKNEGKAEGIEETKISNAKAFILLNKLSLEEIASCCNLTLEKVQELADELKKCKYEE